MCGTHYERKRLGRDISAVGDLRKRERPKQECSVPGCPDVAKARGFCQGHYKRWQSTGDPGDPKKRDKDKVCTSLRSGYVRIYEPGHPLASKDGYVFEHRYVLWAAGQDPRGFEVHHIDHNPRNNDLSNLQLLSPGEHQRVHHAKPGAVIHNQFGVWPIRK